VGVPVFFGRNKSKPLSETHRAFLQNIRALSPKFEALLPKSRALLKKCRSFFRKWKCTCIHNFYSFEKSPVWYSACRRRSVSCFIDLQKSPAFPQKSPTFPQHSPGGSHSLWWPLPLRIEHLFPLVQHTATHFNTLQHTTTHYNTLQHTATTHAHSTCSSQSVS